MTRRRHAVDAHEAEHENGERWLLTYSDMITLLLALFIVLFAASSINSKKFIALATGFRQAFNPNPGILSASNGLLANASLAPIRAAASRSPRTSSRQTEQTSRCWRNSSASSGLRASMA